MIKYINLNRLNRREKYYVTAAALVIAVFLIFQLIIFPISNKRERLERALAQKTEAIQEMRTLQAEYLELEKTALQAKSELARRDKNFQLNSFLYSLAGQVGITDNVDSMKPSDSVVKGVKIATVRVEIDAITMEQFAKYLHQIEYSGNNLFVKRIIISKTTKPDGYVDVSLQVETVES